MFRLSGTMQLNSIHCSPKMVHSVFVNSLKCDMLTDFIIFGIDTVYIKENLKRYSAGYINDEPI